MVITKKFLIVKKSQKHFYKKKQAKVSLVIRHFRIESNLFKGFRVHRNMTIELKGEVVTDSTSTANVLSVHDVWTYAVNTKQTNEIIFTNIQQPVH